MIIAILTNGVCCETRTSKASTKVCQWLSSNEIIKNFDGTSNENCDVITIKLENDQLIK